MNCARRAGLRCIHAGSSVIDTRGLPVYVGSAVTRLIRRFTCTTLPAITASAWWTSAGEL